MSLSLCPALVPSLPQIPVVLLRHYCSIVEGDSRHSSEQPDVALVASCAFSLPGLLVTLGGVRWGDVRHVFQKLARHPDRGVRVPIACSLHEVRRACVSRAARQRARDPLVGGRCFGVCVCSNRVPFPTLRWQIARIIGPEVAVIDVVPVFNLYLKDM
jgi:hypothetical protein